ncbi:hypothetical protein PVK06_002946 [Gossypium arboreum]|uniref:Uncharacterized protein n=1 Tax=Gossypium arboreum TaxID=29729 RepID=A0ABR0R650_GOSAR|nr:hypothetical protein PVK06_002946 [Gossypium arboreum]
MFGIAAAGGVLRYGNEDWIMGYNRFLGECSVFDAELELNEIANCMAKLAFDIGQNLTMFEKTPKEALAISPIVKTSVSLAQKSSV